MKYAECMALIISFALAGCANMNSIYRTDELAMEEPSVVSVDARQRFILTNVVDGDLRVCAEQFPDAFTVASASASGGGSFIPGLGGGGNEAQANAAGAYSESGATVARTQTVNLLRESMFRTCERFMSGAITRDQMITQSTRDSRTMVSVLAIEQLTGMITPSATALTTESTATSLGAALQMVRTLDEAKTDLDSATEQYEHAQINYENYLGGATNCSQSSSFDACVDARESYVAAEESLDTSRDHYELMFSIAGSYARATTGGAATALGGGANTAPPSYLDHPESVKAVTDAVVTIVRLSQDADDMSAVCANYFLSRNSEAEKSRQAAFSPEQRQREATNHREMTQLCAGVDEASVNEAVGINAATRTYSASPLPAGTPTATLDFVVNNSAGTEGVVGALYQDIVASSLLVDPWSYATENPDINDARVIVEYTSNAYAQTGLDVAQFVASRTFSEVCYREVSDSPGYGEINVLLPPGFSRADPQADFDHFVEAC